jgi:hypothetical protein
MVGITLSINAGQNAPNAEIRVDEAGRGWSLGGKPLTKGQRLSAIVELSGNEADSSDLVLNCGKDGLIAYACKQQACRVPVCSTKVAGVIVAQFDSNHLRRAIAAQSGVAADPYLKRQPNPLAILGVRAGGSLSDAVVRRVGSDVHWAPVFKRVLEGTYCLRVTALPVGEKTSRNITINWDRTVDSEGILSIPNLEPGLYAVEKGTPDAGGKCVLDPDLPAAWVLVLSEADFEPVERDWRDSLTRLSQLESAGASPSVIATFRHAVLSYLADSTRAKSPL